MNASLIQHKKTEELCPQCGQALHIRNSRQGAFLCCSNYPTCDHLRPLHEKNEIKKRLSGSHCPLCHKELVLKQGRYGLFIGCSDYPQCHYIAPLTDNKKNEENNTHITCPLCKKEQLVKRQSRYGKTFYACDSYPCCKYAVNDKPVNEFCPDCHWPILVKRQSAQTLRLICPKKGCGYRSKSI